MIDTDSTLTFYKTSNFEPEFPFEDVQIDLYEPNVSKGIVVHGLGESVALDDNVHVYYEKTNNTEVFTIKMYDDSPVPTEYHLYVKYGKNDKDNENILRFLNLKKFFAEGTGFLEITENIKNSDLLMEGSWLDKLLEKVNKKLTQQQYFEILLKDILIEDDLSNENNVNDQIREILSFYSNELIVAFTDKSIDGDTYANMEIKEFLGDRAIWSILTKFFIKWYYDIEPFRKENENDDELQERMIKHFEKNQMNQNLITSMHRAYASKQFQGSISYSLGMYKHIKTNRKISIDTHEDLFEAFVGVLHDISFRAKITKGIDYDLAGKFIYKTYNSFNLQEVDETPAISQFNEYMRLFISKGDKPLFVLKKQNEMLSLVLDKKINNILEEYIESKSTINGLVRELKKEKRFKLSVTPKDIDEFFSEKVKAFVDIVHKNKILELKVRKNTMTWDTKIKEILFELMDGQLFSVYSRNIDNDWKDIYWVIEIFDESYKPKTILSTENEDNSDLPETLIYVIKKNFKLLGDVVEYNESSEMVSFVKKSDSCMEYIKTDDGEFELSGRPAAVKKRIIEYLTNKRAKYYINMMGEFIEYNIDPVLKFNKNFRIKPTTGEDITTFSTNLLKSIVKVKMDFNFTTNNRSYPIELYEFVGNRYLLMHGSKIFNYTLKNMDEHKLTNLQKFYFSKNVKKELQDIMKSPFTFDHIVGYLSLVNENYSEILINHIYMNIVVDDNVSITYYAQVNEISKYLSKTNDNMFNRFKLVDRDKYVFIAPDGKQFEVHFAGKDYRRVREMFNKEAYNYIHKVYGTSHISMIRNQKFSKMNGYSNLTFYLRQHEINDWFLTVSEIKKQKKITLNYKSNDESIKSLSSFSTDPLNDIYNKLSRSF